MDCMTSQVGTRARSSDLPSVAIPLDPEDRKPEDSLVSAFSRLDVRDDA